MGGIEAFDGTRVDAEDSGRGHKLTQGDIALAGRPLALTSGILPLHDATDHHLTIGLKDRGISLTLRDHLIEESINVVFGDFGPTGDDHEVRSVGDLRLIPGNGTELGTDGGVGDDEELPRLQAVGGRCETEGFL